MTRSEPPYAAGGTASNGPATWAMRTGQDNAGRVPEPRCHLGMPVASDRAREALGSPASPPRRPRLLSPLPLTPSPLFLLLTLFLLLLILKIHIIVAILKTIFK